MREKSKRIGEFIIIGLLWEVTVWVWQRIEDHTAWLVAALAGGISLIADFPTWSLLPVIVGVGLIVSLVMNRAMEKREAKYAEISADLFADQLSKELEPSIRDNLAALFERNKEEIADRMVGDASHDAAEMLAYAVNMTPEERARVERERRENVRARILEIDEGGVLKKLLEEREEQEESGI